MTTVEPLSRQQRGILLSPASIANAFQVALELPTLFSPNMKLGMFDNHMNNPELPNLIELIICIRVRQSSNPNLSLNRRFAHVCIELVSAYMQPVKILNQDSARGVLINTAEYFIDMIFAGESILGVNLDAAQLARGILVSDNETRFAPVDYTGELTPIVITKNAVQKDQNLAMSFLKLVALLVPRRITIFQCIITGISALTKMACISQNFAAKLNHNIMTELNINFQLNFEVCRLVWSFFRLNLDDNMVGPLIKYYQGAIPAHAIATRILFQKLSYTGMFSYMTIVTAYEKYADFGWNRVQHYFPEAMAAFIHATGIAGRNPYYGYLQTNKIKSTQFKELAWVAKELLVRIDGQNTLDNYRGWCKPIYQADLIAIINEYMAARVTDVPVETASYQPLINAMAALAVQQN